LQEQCNACVKVLGCQLWPTVGMRSIAHVCGKGSVNGHPLMLPQVERLAPAGAGAGDPRGTSMQKITAALGNVRMTTLILSLVLVSIIGSIAAVSTGIYMQARNSSIAES